MGSGQGLGVLSSLVFFSKCSSTRVIRTAYFKTQHNWNKKSFSVSTMHKLMHNLKSIHKTKKNPAKYPFELSMDDCKHFQTCLLIAWFWQNGVSTPLASTTTQLRIQGGPGARPYLAAKISSKSCSFQAIFRENSYFWANFGFRAPPPWGQNCAGPLTKILDPRLIHKKLPPFLQSKIS